MALIDVTIDVRDFDPDTGPVPMWPSVTFARLSPTTENGVLVTTSPVQVPLVAGHGAVKLRSSTAYLVHCLSFGGFAGTFAVMTGTAPTSLAALWQTCQIDPTGFGALPVPQSVEQALAAQAAAAAITYATKAELSATGGGFQYLQSTAAASWTIPHAFGRRPNVEIYTLAGERIFSDVTASTTAVYVTYPTPTAGYAVLT